MEADDGEDAARRETAMQRSVKGGFQLFEFLIDDDPQGLKDARRRMLVSAMRRAMRRAGNSFGQIEACLNRFPGPRLDDVPGDVTAVWIFAVAIDDVGELLFRKASDEVGRRFSLTNVEPQIERTIGVEAESARLVGQLVGRIADVQQDAIDSGNLQVGEDARQLSIAGLEEVNVGAGEMTGRNLQHHRIPVKTDQRTFGADAPENLATVPRGTDRPVDHRQPGSERQRMQSFAQENGHMDGAGRNKKRPSRQTGVFRHDGKMRGEREDEGTGGAMHRLYFPTPQE